MNGFVALAIAIAFLVSVLVTAGIAGARGSTSDGLKIPGVCAFDLDGTVTCGESSARAAVQACKNLGMRLAINTARPHKLTSDIDLVALGLDGVPDEDFYSGLEYACSFESPDCFHAAVAETKVRHLESMATRYGIPRSRVILFDDLVTNVNAARARGFSAVHANNPGCGLPVDVVDKINKLVAQE